VGKVPHASGGLCHPFFCESSQSDHLQRVIYVLDEHVKLFSRKQPMSIEWGEIIETKP
jgi:hypothetical protein